MSDRLSLKTAFKPLQTTEQQGGQEFSGGSPYMLSFSLVYLRGEKRTVKIYISSYRMVVDSKGNAFAS